MELLLETTKGRLQPVQPSPSCLTVGSFQPSPSAWAGQLSIVNCQLTSFMQLVVPRAVSAAVRMDTTT